MRNHLIVLLPLSLIAAASLAPGPVRRVQAAGSQLWPIVPIICEYQYAPRYFTEWIDDNPQYSMIEGEVKDGNPAIHLMVLTEKKTGRRVYYCDTPSWVEYLKSRGTPAYLAKIEFRTVQGSGQQPTYAFGFRDEKGQAILWRFIPASEPSSQGEGLTPQDNPVGLTALYRDIATLAGEGSAVQIGDKVSEAASWPEVSSPPYFVAYRGAYSAGLHMGRLEPGTESWHIVKAPEALQEGAQWEMTNDSGARRQLAVLSVKGDEVTIAQTNHSLGGDLRLTALKSERGLGIESLSLADEKHSMKIDFKPAISLWFPDGSSASTPLLRSDAAFQISEDGHRKVIEGKINIEGTATGLHAIWKPESPAWAKKHVLNASLSATGDGYKITVE